VLKLCRLRFHGAPHTWGFAIYLASRDGYEDNFLPSGRPSGSPEEALDCACGLYPGDPTAWITKSAPFWPSPSTRPGLTGSVLMSLPVRWLNPERHPMADIPAVLFVCTHNAGHSQKAAALLDHQAAWRHPGDLGRITTR
jgi:hypothetical protein